MLGHQLGDGYIPVQLIGDELAIAKRLFHALLFNLPVTIPATQDP